MGATASVDNLKYGNDIVDIQILIDEKLDKLALYDSKAILAEDKKKFKDHKLLIKILTSSSKFQLLKLDKTITSEFLNIIAGGSSSYGNFLSSLLKSGNVLDSEYLNKTMNGMGLNIDEFILNNVLCSKNTDEIKDLCYYYKLSYNIELYEKIMKKTKTHSPTQLFLSRILKCDRDESSNICDNTVELLAIEIGKLIRENTYKSIKEFIEILATTSRVLCSAINDKFIDIFNQSLESVIAIKFSKEFTRGIFLWISPLEISVANVITDIGNNCKDDFIYLLCRYDKLFLNKVNDEMKSICGKNLSEFISSKCSGHFKEACLSWVQSCSCLPDKGVSLILTEYLRNQRILYGNDAVNTKLRDNKSECYTTTMMHLDTVNIHLRNTLEKKNEIIISKKLSEKNIKKLNVLSDNIEEQCKIKESYEIKRLVVLEYILLHFNLADVNGSGILESTEFWNLFNGLRLDLMGFTAEEVIYIYIYIYIYTIFIITNIYIAYNIKNIY
jgi:hypothetical protein